MTRPVTDKALAPQSKLQDLFEAKIVEINQRNQEANLDNLYERARNARLFSEYKKQDSSLFTKPKTDDASGKKVSKTQLERFYNDRAYILEAIMAQQLTKTISSPNFRIEDFDYTRLLQSELPKESNLKLKFSPQERKELVSSILNSLKKAIGTYKTEIEKKYKAEIPEAEFDEKKLTNFTESLTRDYVKTQISLFKAASEGLSNPKRILESSQTPSVDLITQAEKEYNDANNKFTAKTLEDLQELYIKKNEDILPKNQTFSKKPFITKSGVIIFGLTQKQETILARIENGENVEIDLGVGEGKSFLNEIMSQLYSKDASQSKDKSLEVAGNIAGYHISEVQKNGFVEKFSQKVLGIDYSKSHATQGKKPIRLSIDHTETTQEKTDYQTVSLKDFPNQDDETIKKLYDKLSEIKKLTDQGYKVKLAIDEFEHLPNKVLKIINKFCAQNPDCIKLPISATPNLRLFDNNFAKANEVLTNRVRFTEDFRNGSKFMLDSFEKTNKDKGKDYISQFIVDLKTTKLGNDNVAQLVLPQISAPQIHDSFRLIAKRIYESSKNITRFISQDANGKPVYYAINSEGNIMTIPTSEFDTLKGSVVTITSSSGFAGADYGKYSRNVSLLCCYSQNPLALTDYMQIRGRSRLDADNFRMVVRHDEKLTKDQLVEQASELQKGVDYLKALNVRKNEVLANLRNIFGKEYEDDFQPSNKDFIKKLIATIRDSRESEVKDNLQRFLINELRIEQKDISTLEESLKDGSELTKSINAYRNISETTELPVKTPNSSTLIDLSPKAKKTLVKANVFLAPEIRKADEQIHFMQMINENSPNITVPFDNKKINFLLKQKQSLVTQYEDDHQKYLTELNASLKRRLDSSTMMSQYHAAKKEGSNGLENIYSEIAAINKSTSEKEVMDKLTKIITTLSTNETLDQELLKLLFGTIYQNLDEDRLGRESADRLRNSLKELIDSISKSKTNEELKQALANFGKTPISSLINEDQYKDTDKKSYYNYCNEFLTKTFEDLNKRNVEESLINPKLKADIDKAFAYIVTNNGNDPELKAITELLENNSKYIDRNGMLKAIQSISQQSKELSSLTQKLAELKNLGSDNIPTNDFLELINNFEKLNQEASKGFSNLPRSSKSFSNIMMAKTMDLLNLITQEKQFDIATKVDKSTEEKAVSGLAQLLREYLNSLEKSKTTADLIEKQPARKVSTPEELIEDKAEKQPARKVSTPEELIEDKAEKQPARKVATPEELIEDKAERESDSNTKLYNPLIEVYGENDIRQSSQSANVEDSTKSIVDDGLVSEGFARPAKQPKSNPLDILKQNTKLDTSSDIVPSDSVSTLSGAESTILTEAKYKYNGKSVNEILAENPGLLKAAKASLGGTLVSEAESDVSSKVSSTKSSETSRDESTKISSQNQVAEEYLKNNPEELKIVKDFADKMAQIAIDNNKANKGDLKNISQDIFLVCARSIYELSKQDNNNSKQKVALDNLSKVLKLDNEVKNMSNKDKILTIMESENLTTNVFHVTKTGDMEPDQKAAKNEALGAVYRALKTLDPEKGKKWQNLVHKSKRSNEESLESVRQ